MLRFSSNFVSQYISPLRVSHTKFEVIDPRSRSQHKVKVLNFKCLYLPHYSSDLHETNVNSLGTISSSLSCQSIVHFISVNFIMAKCQFSCKASFEPVPVLRFCSNFVSRYISPLEVSHTKFVVID